MPTHPLFFCPIFFANTQPRLSLASSLHPLPLLPETHCVKCPCFNWKFSSLFLYLLMTQIFSFNITILSFFPFATKLLERGVRVYPSCLHFLTPNLFLNLPIWSLPPSTETASQGVITARWSPYPGTTSTSSSFLSTRQHFPILDAFYVYNSPYLLRHWSLWLSPHIADFLIFYLLVLLPSLPNHPPLWNVSIPWGSTVQELSAKMEMSCICAGQYCSHQPDVANWYLKYG